MLCLCYVVLIFELISKYWIRNQLFLRCNIYDNKTLDISSSRVSSLRLFLFALSISYDLILGFVFLPRSISPPFSQSSRLCTVQLEDEPTLLSTALHVCVGAYASVCEGSLRPHLISGRPVASEPGADTSTWSVCQQQPQQCAGHVASAHKHNDLTHRRGTCTPKHTHTHTCTYTPSAEEQMYIHTVRNLS